jgi:hypothetical protein
MVLNVIRECMNPWNHKYKTLNICILTATVLVLRFKEQKCKAKRADIACSGGGHPLSSSAISQTTPALDSATADAQPTHPQVSRTSSTPVHFNGLECFPKRGRQRRRPNKPTALSGGFESEAGETAPRLTITARLGVSRRGVGNVEGQTSQHGSSGGFEG